MRAAEVLKAVRKAGIELEVEGDDLVWEADKQPTAEVLDLLSCHMAVIVRLLRRGDDGWSVEDWQDFFDERADFAEQNGYPRLGYQSTVTRQSVAIRLIVRNYFAASASGFPFSTTRITRTLAGSLLLPFIAA